MRGEARGRLAVALDVLTDAMVLVGQHGVYCKSERNPEVPKMDVQAVLAGISGAKELVASVMEKLRLEKETSGIYRIYWADGYVLVGSAPFDVKFGGGSVGVFKAD